VAGATSAGHVIHMLCQEARGAQMLGVKGKLVCCPLDFGGASRYT
jgi:hypothetical protein